MKYVAKIVGFNEIIEEEVMININGVEIIGFVPVYPSFLLEISKEYLVELDLYMNEEYEIKEKNISIKEARNIEPGYDYIFTGKLNIDEGCLDSSIRLKIDKEYLFDIGYLDNKYISITVDRVNVYFIEPL